MNNIPDILKKIVETKKTEVLQLVKNIQAIKREAAASIGTALHQPVLLPLLGNPVHFNHVCDHNRALLSLCKS